MDTNEIDDNKFFEDWQKEIQEEKAKAAEEKAKKEEAFWERRRWDLATRLFVQDRKSPMYGTILTARKFIEEYRKEMQYGDDSKK